MIKYDLEVEKAKIQTDIDHFNNMKFDVLAQKFTNILNIIKALETEIQELQKKPEA